MTEANGHMPATGALSADQSNLAFGLFVGYMVVLLPVGLLAQDMPGTALKDFGDAARLPIFASALGGLTGMFASPSGIRGTVLAALGGFAVAALAFSGALAAELALAGTGNLGTAATFAVRFGGMIPALFTAGVTIRFLAPARGAPKPRQPAPPGRHDEGLPQGLREAAAGIAVMLGGVIAMFAAWQAMGWFGPRPGPIFPLAMPAVFGPVVAAGLTVFVRERGGTNAAALLAGGALVAAVWAVTTLATTIALPDVDLAGHPEATLNAVTIGAAAGLVVVLFAGGVLLHKARRQLRNSSQAAAPSEPRRRGRAIAPLHSVSALSLVIALRAFAQAAWPEGGEFAFILSLFPAMAIIVGQPEGRSCWLRTLGVAAAGFAILLAGTKTAVWLADRWADGKPALAVVLMLGPIVPAVIVAITLQIWLFRTTRRHRGNREDVAEETEPEGDGED